MKILVIVLIALLCLLQYKLWVNHHGIREYVALKKQVTQLKSKNQVLKKRNDQLYAQVKDLKEGHQSIEAHAREELGMIKPGEQFYQILKPAHGK